MEESNLLKKRFQEKHRIQDDIRWRKLELDQEMLKVKHLKNKALREKWLLQESHNATHSSQQQTFQCDQQQTSALPLNIYRIEMAVEALEQQESVVSTTESFILNRLKAVEKSPKEIIKEAPEDFVPELAEVAMVIPDVPQLLSSPVKNHNELDTTKKTAFAMDISVTKNLVTGERAVPPEELHQLNRLNVWDSRKCVHTLDSQQGSCDQTCVTNLSANEVEQLLRSATVLRQVKYQNSSKTEAHCFYSHPHESNKVEECEFRTQGKCDGSHVLGNSTAETDLSCQRVPRDEYQYGHQGNYYSEEKIHSQSNRKDSYHFGNNKAVGYNYGNCPYSCHQVNSVYTHRSAVHHSNSFIRGNRVNGDKPNGCPPPKSHDQDAVSACPKQICYTPANYILPRNYISVDEELYCYSPPSYQNTAHYSGPIASDRVPPPIYRDDALYTILNTMETTEPTTAIFMGFQMVQDDRHSQEFKSSLKAELVFLEDSEENGKDISIEEKRSHSQRGANGGMGLVEECRNRQTERQVRPGIKKVQKKHKPCCNVS